MGFRLAGVLFLNDSFSENGAQEYAVVRGRIEIHDDASTTFELDEDSHLEFLTHVDANTFEGWLGRMLLEEEQAQP